MLWSWWWMPAMGVTASDEQIVRMLRRVKKPIILIANKIDDAPPGAGDL